MMQKLLEDRFKLKTHREIREIPVYALTIAKSSASLRSVDGGSCTPFDLEKAMTPPRPSEKPMCGGRRLRNGPNEIWEGAGVSFDQMSQTLGMMVDRPVINRTGVSGLFAFRIEYGTDDSSDDPARAPSIFTALQQLGLKLESTKGPGEFLVVDHVEKPSEN